MARNLGHRVTIRLRRQGETHEQDWPLT
jgi:hypothetical protein